jgi:hypothetical protein
MIRAIGAGAICAALAFGPTAAQAPDGNSQTRGSYARSLGRELVGRGLDLQVFAEEKRDDRLPTPDTFPKYPRLVFFGPMNAPLAYRIIADANLLNAAKSYGFAGVRFFADSGYFDFDLSGAELPDCDSSGRVCTR